MYKGGFMKKNKDKKINTFKIIFSYLKDEKLKLSFSKNKIKSQKIWRLL